MILELKTWCRGHCHRRSAQHRFGLDRLMQANGQVVDRHHQDGRRELAFVTNRFARAGCSGGERMLEARKTLKTEQEHYI